VHSHINFSCDLPNHLQGDPKMGAGKRVLPVPGHFRRWPSLSSSQSWLKNHCHVMQVTEPPQRTTYKLRCCKFYLGKLFRSDMSYARSGFEDVAIPRALPSPPDAPPVWLPTCQHGCSVNQTKELTPISTATQWKFPQAPAFVTLSFLCTHHEAGLKG